jgi:hypothetical protein
MAPARRLLMLFSVLVSVLLLVLLLVFVLVFVVVMVVLVGRRTRPLRRASPARPPGP